MRGHVVPGHAVAVGVQHAERELGSGVSLFRRPAIPGERLRVVLRHAAALGVERSEVELGAARDPDRPPACTTSALAQRPAAHRVQSRRAIQRWPARSALPCSAACRHHVMACA